MSRIAHEVSRRMTPGYAKERAREMARDRMFRARDRAVESSWFAPLLGAGVGALVAKALQSRAQERSWERGRYGWRGDGGYPRGRYAELAGEREEHDLYGAAPGSTEGRAGVGPSGAEPTGAKLGEKASEVKDRARATAEQVKGRFQEATSSMRERIPDRERIRESTREDTGLWALGALALGALFGFALPETEREREMLEPARRKARELGAQARDVALEKGSEAMERATEKVASAGGERSEGQPGTGRGGVPPAPGSPTPLH
jgi:hypothetical protein